LLNDPDMCPVDLRDSRWGYYYRLCQRDRYTFDTGSVETQVSYVSFVKDDARLLIATTKFMSHARNRNQSERGSNFFPIG
jgi:hypothetical protein